MAPRVVLCDARGARSSSMIACIRTCQVRCPCRDGAARNHHSQGSSALFHRVAKHGRAKNAPEPVHTYPSSPALRKSSVRSGRRVGAPDNCDWPMRRNVCSRISRCRPSCWAMTRPGCHLVWPCACHVHTYVCAPTVDGCGVPAVQDTAEAGIDRDAVSQGLSPPRSTRLDDDGNAR